VPDATSAVALAADTAALDVTLSTDITVRKLRLGPTAGSPVASATLRMDDHDVHITDSLDFADGTLAMKLDGRTTPRVTVGGAAGLNGTLDIAFAQNYIALPGTHTNLLSFTSATGTPSITNDTGYAGLTITPTVGTSSLSLDFSAKPGDADLNAIVGFTDLVTLAQHYNLSTEQTWLTGDFNGDAGVNFADLVLLAQNYGSQNTFAADWALAQSMVPEPTTLSIFAAAPIFLRRRSR
jgi:hypothetical protein